MSDLDSIIRESLGRLAEPGDPSGVASAIQARVDAGGMSDGGAGGGAAGTGGSGLAGWIPVGIIIAAAAGIGATLGTTADASGGSSAPYAPLTITPSGGIPAASCPGRPAVTELDGGARVLAIARSEDGAFVAVRDPGVLTRTVWVQAELATPDEGTDPSSLPVESCVTASDAPSASPSPSVTPSESAAPEPSETAKPEETTKPTPKPTKTSKPKPTETTDPEPEDKKPNLKLNSWNPGTIVGDADDNDGSCTHAKSATITMTASDDHSGLTVTGSANFYPAGLSQVSHSGSTWVFKYEAINNSGPTQDVTITFTAKDSANQKVSKTSHITVTWPGNECVG